MEQQRFATRSAWTAFVLCAAFLLAWAVFGPLMRSVKPTALFAVYPMSALMLALASLGLAALAGNWRPQLVRAYAALTVLLAAVFMGELLLGMEGGLELAFTGESNPTLPWRPAPQTSLSMLLLGLAMLTASIHRNSRLDAGDTLSAAAVLLPAVVLLGYLFDANELYKGTGQQVQGTSPLVVFVQFLLAVGVIAAQPGRGLMAAFLSQSAGAVVGRRLLPFIVTLPVVFGWLLILGVRNGVMDLPLALALSVTATTTAFTLLIYWAINLMSHLEATQTAHHEKRESAAKEEGMTDALTGLLNRRGWEHHLTQEEEVCAKQGRNGCVVMIDLDDLKKVNDTQGHTQGDELIKRAATALRHGARSGDILARLGGDEFAYLAIGCQPEHAGVVVRRLAESMMKHQVGASLGYAMRDINVNLQGAFDEADRSMYANKRARKAKKALEASRA